MVPIGTLNSKGILGIALPPTELGFCSCHSTLQIITLSFIIFGPGCSFGFCNPKSAGLDEMQNILLVSPRADLVIQFQLLCQYVGVGSSVIPSIPLNKDTCSPGNCLSGQFKWHFEDTGQREAQGSCSGPCCWNSRTLRQINRLK